MTDYQENFIQKMRFYRKRAGITQAGLAELCSVSNGTIGNIECGITKPSFDLIIKIANVSPYSQVVTFELPGGLTGAERTSLHSDNPYDENTLDEPERVVPVTEPLDLTPVADPANEWLLGVRRLENGRTAYSERLGGRTFAIYKFRR